MAGRLVDDGKNPPAEFGQQRRLQIAVLEHVALERAIDDGVRVERAWDESVLRINGVFDGVPLDRRFAEGHPVRYGRRMRDRLKRTDRQNQGNRDADAGEPGNIDSHELRLRASGVDLQANIKWLEEMAKNLAAGWVGPSRNPSLCRASLAA